MENLPESLADEFQNYEVTVEPGHLTLIVSTVDGDLHTYTFKNDEEGTLALQSQTENGSQVDDGVPDEVAELIKEHPVLSPDSISDGE